MTIRILALLLGGLLASPLFAEDLPPIPASLVPAGPPITARADLYGHNMTCKDWQGTDKFPPVFWDAAADKPLSAWEPLTHLYPLHLVRFHMENNYPWRDEVGPRTQRKPFRGEGGVYTTGAGLDELLRWAETLPDPPRVSLIASPIRPVTETADLVAYCNAMDGPMAALRAANGHPSPYRVGTWELGNEVDWIKRKDLDPNRPDTSDEANTKMTADEYVALCRPLIAAMRAVDPSIHIYAHAQTGPWPRTNPDWAQWHRTVLAEMGGDIDGLVIHPYYDGYPVPYVLQSVDALLADIHKLGPKDRPLSVWISEHARWINYKDLDERPQSWSLQGAISTADFLLQCMGRPGIAMANYWCYASRGPWKVLNADWEHGNDPKFGTSLNGLYQLLNEAYADRFQPLRVETAFAGNSPGYSYTVTAGRFETASGSLHALVAINRSESQSFALRLKAPVPGASPGKFLLLTAPSLRSTNVPATPDAVVLQTLPAPPLSPDAEGALVLPLPPRCVAAWIWE